VAKKRICLATSSATLASMSMTGANAVFITLNDFITFTTANPTSSFFLGFTVKTSFALGDDSQFVEFLI
jgi:hypothetical protein